jgi:uncharacterized protein (DUF1697 family)
MNTFISMLRGVNVSEQNKIRMAELADLYHSLSLVNVETYVQSGNVVFEATEQEASKLAELIETQIEGTFGYTVSVFMRDVANFQRIIHNNPFLNKRAKDPARLYVTFLYSSPSESKLSNMASLDAGADEFIVGEQAIYLFCPNGYGRTKLSNNLFERKLGLPATTRNWKTVTTLYSMAAAHQAGS